MIDQSDIDWKMDSRIFDKFASLIDKYCPDYPEELAESVIMSNKLLKGGRILR
ncbi:MAG: hypothetical protein ABSF99_06230 [Anaerolineales bacterium]|jgi:hypothetical protein